MRSTLGLGPLFEARLGFPARTQADPQAWKGHDWDVLNRLCEKGLISDPKSKSKSVWFTDEGFSKVKELFEQKYTKKA